MNKPQRVRAYRSLSRLIKSQYEIGWVIDELKKKIESGTERYLKSEKGYREQYQLNGLQKALQNIDLAIGYIENIDIDELSPLPNSTQRRLK